MSEFKDIAALPAVQALSSAYQVTGDALVGTFSTVAMPKGHTKGELISCILVAKEHGLNPLTKEIYFMRTKAGIIQPIVGVDGWIRKCNEHPAFDGMEFEDVKDAKGNLSDMICTIWRKDRSRPTRVSENLAECIAGGGPVWKTMPRRMLRNRVMAQCSRISFGFAGIMLPDEFDAWEGGIKDVTPSMPDIPDIPDLPVDDGVEDPPISDVAGLLAKIKEDVEIAGSDAAVLAEVAEQYEDLIARLPEDAQGRALEMLEP